MTIRYLIWLDYVEDKLVWKHNITKDEVKEVLHSKPKVLFKEKGDVDGEDLYNALGRTEAGRYLSIFYIHKTSSDALILSARDMTNAERKRYGKK
ncbi:MAG: BrnT family toxin [Bacteroidetes bacterium]|nr:BrnT family toxin [Bacteroidota bacterium]MCW5895497.1 BrnT family toxin [Bacteroidota bacterium]